MKKGIVLIMVAVVFLALVSSCASRPATAQASGASDGARPSNESGVTVAAMKTSILDWQGRTVNTPPIPTWLGPATMGDYTMYEAAYGIQANSGLLRFSTGLGADVRAGTMHADINYARVIARELQQSISVYAAEKARSGSMTQETAQAIEEITKTKSEADITGHQKRTEFWQLTDSEDPLTGRTTRQYIVYQIYSINPEAWAATTAKYIRDVIGEMPANHTLEQREVADMLTEMMNDARQPLVLSQEQARMKLEAENRMIDAQINLMPAQQDAAARAELARINQEAITERTTVRAEQQTAQAQALADGRAQQAAYLSGDPVLRAAASTTPADAAWVNAMNIAASILYQ